MLSLNLDETSVCLFQGNVAGNVLLSKKRARSLGQSVPRAKRRCCMTHVGLICNRSDIQPQLPQVFIINERTVPARDMAALRAACPSNVHLVRQKSAWTNAFLTAWVVRLIGIALAPFRTTLQPILLMDSLRAHWHPFVLAACRGAQIWPLCVPASMTWLMQPLDTHVFLKYKTHLRQIYQDARGDAEVSDLDFAAFMRCVYQTIRSVLQGYKWAGAFRGVGFGNAQSDVERFVRRNLGMLEAPLALSSVRPSDAEISTCFDARYRPHFADLWRTLVPPVAAVRLGPPRRPAAAAKAGSLELAIGHGRGGMTTSEAGLLRFRCCRGCRGARCVARCHGAACRQWSRPRGRRRARRKRRRNTRRRRVAPSWPCFVPHGCCLPPAVAMSTVSMYFGSPAWCPRTRARGRARAEKISTPQQKGNFRRHTLGFNIWGRFWCLESGSVFGLSFGSAVAPSRV